MLNKSFYSLGIIKPDATKRGIQDKIISDITVAGFTILDSISHNLTREEVEWLYSEHKDKDWFQDQISYMLSGPVVLLKIFGDFDDTPGTFIMLMGPTDHRNAKPGTLRAKYAIGFRENSIHGSDGPESAIRELNKFFPYV